MSLVEETNKVGLEINKKDQIYGSIKRALHCIWKCETWYISFLNSEGLYISWKNSPIKVN